MKKILLLLLVGMAAPAMAQETYSLSATAQQVSDLTLIVTAANGRACESFNLAETCTQAQACTAANAAGGASCTAAQARAANARIFPLTQPGREEFVTFMIAAPRFQDFKVGIVGRDHDKMCQFWSTATQVQKDTTCTSVGRSAGCQLCP